MLRQAAYACFLLGVFLLGFSLNASLAPADPPAATYVPGEVILKFKNNASDHDKAQVYAELGGAKLKGFGRIKAELRRVETMSVEDAVSRYHSHPKIEYIEPNYILQANEIPNDSRFSELYGLHNTGQTGGTADADIDATEAWDVFTGSHNVLIGVIDTGVDYNHPDLAANIWTNPGEIAGNNVDDDQNGYVDDVHGYDFVNSDGNPMDDHGHGSHCSGTIGGVGNNGIGVAGVNWNVTIMGLKFLNASGSGSTAGAIEAVNYATMMGVRLTSNSWGGGGFSQGLLDAINAADAAGILFVAAAGNSSANTDASPHYPSSYAAPNIIAVAATDHNDNLASFSNFGATTVDLAAPGVNTLSTTPGNTYSVFSGTSMATPHVAGALGLVFGRFPNIGHQDAKSLILSFVDPKASLAGKCVTGGRLNAFFPIADPDSIPPAGIDDLAVAGTTSNGANLQWTAPGDDGNTGTASGYVVKFSTSPINAGNFDAATTVPNPPDPGPAGTSESMEVGGLDFNTTYHFAVRARDEFGNAGDVSNSADGTTLGIPDIAVAPPSLTESLITGGTSTQNLTLSNVGQGTLDYNIPTPELITNAVEQQTFASYGKDEIDPRVGNPVTEGSGGPDGFGYRWVDSDQPFGPTFVWNDISGTGTTAITSGDDINAGPFPIGFDFSFYGVSYNSFRVCSNGWLSFTSTSNAYTNQPLPNAGAPLNLIAPFWDDLNVSGTSRVYFQSTGNTLTIQWNSIPHYGGGGPYSFQAVLHEDGSIDFYYLSMTSPLNSATLGLQNATGTDGLNIAYNTAYLHDNLAIRIQAVPQWVTVTPASGRVYAPGSTNLDVNFATEGLLGGTYEANVRIQSNDPDEPTFAIPVTLTVIGAPDINLAPASFDFGQVFLNASPTTQVQVQNPGTDVLHVSGVTILGAGYTVSPTSFNVPPHGSQVLTVEFHPTSVGMYPATLTVASDDPDEPSVSMTITGEGVVPPAFSVNPTELSSNLFSGQIESQQLVLQNSGGAPLTYSIATDLGVEVISYPDQELQKGEEDPGPGVLGSGGPDPFGYSWRDSDDPGGPVFNWIDISSTGTPIAALTTDDQNAGPINLGFSFPFYGNNFTSVRVCTNGWLSFTATTTQFSNAALPTGGTALPNNLIAPFWDDIHFRGTARARYLADGTKFIVQYTNVDRAGTVGNSNLTFQVILYPNGTIVYQYLSMTGTLNSATIGIQNATRTVGTTVVHNAAYVHNNMAIRIQTAPQWLTAAPTSGTIPAGGQQVVNVSFNATDLFGGLYEGGFDITTNDPLANLVHIPAALTVTGAPNIQFSVSAIDFGTVYVGYPQLREFSMFNTGTDDLVVTALSCSNPEFTPDLSEISLPLTLAPLSGTVLRARFSPGNEGNESDVLAVVSNDPDSPTAGLPLSGLGLFPPAVNASPASISASLLTGQTTDQTVTLHNSGQSNLTFQIESHTSLGVETIPADPEGIDIGKGEVDPRQGILGAGGPDPFGYRWADSDAPNGPPYNWIDISGTGTPVFAARSDDSNAGPFGVGFNFPFYGSVFSQVRICSNGWLSFTNTTSDLSNDPLPSTNAPENLIAVLWDDLVVDPEEGGQVYYLSEPARFIVQWENVQKYSEQTGPRFSFQAILFRNGTIVTQYKALGTTRNSLSIGIQNGTKTVGLTTVYNQDYVDQNLAVRFSTAPDWLSADPTGGTIPPGGSLPIQATFNATGLFGGVYQGELKILSNDPQNGALSIPAALSVTGVPDLELSATALDFGDVYVGYPESLPLIVSNMGSDVLHVSSITAGLSAYTVNPSSLDLEPYESQTVTVSFGPSAAGPHSSSLSFQSDDPSSPHTATLAGNGVLPPVISSEPATVVGTAAPGSQALRTLTLCNTGGSDLTFTVNWVEASSGATYVYSELKLGKQEDTQGSTPVVDPRPGILGNGGPDAFGYRWVDSDDPAGPDFAWTDISGIGTPVNFGTYTDDGTRGPHPIGFNFPFYGNPFSQFYVCSNGWVSFTEGTLTSHINQPLPNNGTGSPANMLAVFWDDMVVDLAYAPGVRYYNDGSRLIIQYDVRRIATFTAPFFKFQVILYPNGKIVYQYHTLGTVVNNATVGIQNGTKTDGLNVVFNNAYLHNSMAIEFSSRPDWLSVGPDAGTIPAGECLDLTVTMNAANLASGDYNAFIHVQSNDPGHPVDTTPVVFHVCQVQVAAIDVDPNTLNATSQGHYVTAHIELPAGYDPALVDLSSVRLNGTVPASTEISAIEDWNTNGVPDLMMKFPREAVEAALVEGNQVPVTITGDIDDVCTFTGTDMVRVIRPDLSHPNGGESFIAGASTLVEWENPNNWTPTHAQIHYSPDGGESWSVVANSVTGESYAWATPLEPTQNGKLRVVLFDALGVMGYDTSDGLFTIRTSTTGIGEGLPTVHRLYQNSPNPFQGATRAAFDLPEGGKVTLKVFDLSGRVVRVLAENWYPAGNHEVSWNAQDAAGKSVAGGIYFLHIDAGSFTDTKRMYLRK